MIEVDGSSVSFAEGGGVNMEGLQVVELNPSVIQHVNKAGDRRFHPELHLVRSSVKLFPFDLDCVFTIYREERCSVGKWYGEADLGPFDFIDNVSCELRKKHIKNKSKHDEKKDCVFLSFRLSTIANAVVSEIKLTRWIINNFNYRKSYRKIKRNRFSFFLYKLKD